MCKIVKHGEYLFGVEVFESVVNLSFGGVVVCHMVVSYRGMKRKNAGD